MGYIGAGISRFNTADELTVTGDAEFNGNANFGDSDKVSFSSGKLEMYHDGTNAYIDETYANGTFLIRGNNISLQKYTGETMIQCVSDGKVELNFNNVPKLETTSSGVSVTGGITVSNNIFETAGTTSIRPAGTEIVTINNTGDVTVIGQGSNRAMMLLKAGSNTANSQLRFGDQAADSAGRILYDHSSNFMRFDTNESERMRIDSSGNLLVGGTNTFPAGNNVVGTAIRPDGDISITKAGDFAIFANRKDSDGGIIDLRKDGTSVGVIGTQNWGIGTASPAKPLTVVGGDFSTVLLDNANASHGTQILFQANGVTNSGADIQMSDAGGMKIRTLAVEPLSFHTSASAGSPSEHMRIDTSGNLLVGKTASGIANNGIELRANNDVLITKDGATALYLNRKSSDGEIIEFRKDGTGVGVIGTVGGDMVAGTGDTGLRFHDGADQVYPSNTNGSGRDAAIDLGNSGARFKDGYFTGTVFAEAFTGRDDTDTAIQMTGSNTMKFFSGGAEKARITSSSTPTILVGCTVNPSASAPGSMVSTTGAGSFTSFAAANTASTHAVFGNLNGAVGTIQTTNSTTAYNTSSDRRLKSNIQDAESASDKIDAIQVRQFDWNADESHQDYGLIAQELQPIEPLAVTGNADSDEMMGVDYSKLVPMLIKEIQELRGRVAALEAS